MQLRICGWPYRVIKQHAPIGGPDGDPVEALAVWPAMELRLSMALQLERPDGAALHDAIRHEYEHAYEFHVPRPRDAEERADLFATIGHQFDAELAAVGGAEALLALEPIDTPAPPEVPEVVERPERPALAIAPAGAGDAVGCEPLIWMDDQQVVVDGMRITPTAVAGLEPGDTRIMPCCSATVASGSIVSGRPHYRGRIRVAPREAVCPSCRHLVVWVESLATGGVADGPHYVRDAARLAEHIRRLPAPARAAIEATA